MVALFLDDSKTNDGKENGKKYVYQKQKNHFACASRYFVHFFAVVVPLYGVGERNRKIVLFFLQT